jgi:hypothetical protein
VELPADGTEIEHHKIALAAEVLRSGGSIRMQAFGTSMLPTIWPGDLLSIEGRPGRVSLGDLMLVQREQGITVHRVVACDASRCITRGDAMPHDDPPANPVDILGRVVEIRRAEQVIVPELRIHPHQRLLAWIFCHSRLCRNLALRVHLAMSKNHRRISEQPVGQGRLAS